MSQNKQNRRAQKQNNQQPAAIDWPDGAADLDSDADMEWRAAIMEGVHQRLRDQAQLQTAATLPTSHLAPDQPLPGTSPVGLLEGNRLWFEAAQYGDLHTLQRLYERLHFTHILNSHQRESGLTALGLAASHGHLETVQWLLKERAWPYYGGQDHQSPLQLAIAGGHDHLVRWLVENGADPNGLDQEGNSPLRAAARSGNLELARWLLEKGALVHGGTAYGIRPSLTPLLVAIEGGYLPIVQLLFQAGAEIPKLTSDGKDVLDLATQSGNHQLAEWLLNHG